MRPGATGNERSMRQQVGDHPVEADRQARSRSSVELPAEQSLDRTENRIFIR